MTRITAYLSAFVLFSVATTVVVADGGTQPHLFVEVLDASNLDNEDYVGKSDPYVEIKAVDKDGDEIHGCFEAKWITNDETLNPAWFSTKMICRKYPTESGAALKVQVKDQDDWSDDKLGKAYVTLTDLGVDKVNIVALSGEKGKYRPEIRIRVRQYYPTQTTKRVYFLRHGQSQWDFLASKMKLDLVGFVDQPLTGKGKDESVAIANRIQSLIDGKASTDAERGLLRATLAMTSPMTRAIETAVIALDPLVRNGSLSAPIVVKRDVRARCSEDRADSYGKWTGPSVKKGVKGELTDLYGDQRLTDTMERSVDRLELSEVNDKWWPSSYPSVFKFDWNAFDRPPEHFSALRERIDVFFLEQLLWYDDSDIIVVGHSFFLKEFIGKHMQEGLEKAIDGDDSGTTHSEYGYGAEDFEDRHLENGGVMALTLDYSGYIAKMEDAHARASTRILQDVRLMFGSKLQPWLQRDRDIPSL